MPPTSIEPDITAEATRVMDAVSVRGGSARLLGGLAVWAHRHDPPEVLRRSYGDIDLVCGRKDGRRTLELLTQLGYVPNERFNAMNGGTRLLLYDVAHERQVDVFVGEFRMCHRVPLDDRLGVEPRTVPLAELLLTKLQVVQLNRKDVQDAASLLLEHDVGEDDDERVNATRVAQLLSADWGLWRTIRGSLDTVREHLPDLGLDAGDQAVVAGRIERLWEHVEAAPKSLRWRSRARIGERAKWYDEPEEVRGADQ